MTIKTHYLGPTNNRGSRIVAKRAGKRVAIDLNSALSKDENHKQAAIELCKKCGWSGQFAIGEHKTGYLFVSTNDILEVEKCP